MLQRLPTGFHRCRSDKCGSPILSLKVSHKARMRAPVPYMKRTEACYREHCAGAYGACESGCESLYHRKCGENCINDLIECKIENAIMCIMIATKEEFKECMKSKSCEHITDCFWGCKTLPIKFNPHVLIKKFQENKRIY